MPTSTTYTFPEWTYVGTGCTNPQPTALTYIITKSDTTALPGYITVNLGTRIFTISATLVGEVGTTTV